MSCWRCLSLNLKYFVEVIRYLRTEELEYLKELGELRPQSVFVPIFRLSREGPSFYLSVFFGFNIQPVLDMVLFGLRQTDKHFFGGGGGGVGWGKFQLILWSLPT